METMLLGLAFLVSSVLFILSLRGLSSQETSRRGNVYGIVGMAIAVGALATSTEVE
ncbi:MAG: NAD(P)(+) transhydrogenase (Re/Si-specific) subunit beta, partial [Myxococcales bacterium]|nr:NAD(P)(+) transhydrogenase (Re/Si-specific) subunit beta [Myxococcales bacterium]